jgi:hypothetical protein
VSRVTASLAGMAVLPPERRVSGFAVNLRP